MERILLCGRAGTGKTARVLADVARLVDVRGAPGELARFQVLVPTYSRAEHLKRRLLRGGGAEGAGLPGLFDRGIGTFEQFAERVTGRRLGGLAPATVREALLERALADADVPEFREVARFAGFRRTLLRFVKEVKGAEPEPGRDAVERAAERLAAAGEGLPGGRGRRLRSVARVLSAYQRRLEAAGLLDHEDLLRELLARLRAAPPRLRLFAVDGFADLTEVQERIVQVVAESADRTVVTLLCDPDRPDEGPCAASSGLRRRLLEGSRFTVEALRGNRRAGGDAARAERLLCGEAVEPAPADGSVRFLAGADPDDEADRAARLCAAWSAEGVPRSEILVVVRRLASDTGSRLLEALRRHGVPARRMGRSSLASVPAARSALRLVRILGGAAEAQDLVEAVRAGDARDVAAPEADRLDRRAAERGLRELPDLLAEARAEGLGTCVRWLERVAAARPPAEPRPPSAVAAALLAPVPRLLRFSFERRLEPGGPGDARAAADAAALRSLATAARETVSALRVAGADAVTPAEFAARLGAAAESAGTAPPDRRVDVVNVVDAEEARQWEARAVIVAGLRLGEFPAGAREDVLVSDADRRDAGRSSGVRLPSRVEEAQRRERLLFYSAVTRARERLVLLAPAADERGEPVARSPLLERLLALLPEGDRVLEGAGRSPGDPRPAPQECLGERDLLRTALGSLTEHFVAGTASAVRPETGLALLRHLARRPGGLDPVVVAARSALESAPELARGGAARARLALPLPRSASALSEFAQCAYRHFAHKGLELEELPGTPEDGLDPRLAGKIAHSVLERALPAGGRPRADPAALFDATWQELAGHLVPGLSLARERALLRQAVLGHLEREAVEPAVPGFTPTELEWPFGMEDTPPLRLGAPEDPEAPTLRGVVDRIDRDGGGRAVVLDYKWSKVGRFAALERLLASGADLQLPLYALAAERLLGVRVVAAGYLTLRDGGSRWLRLAADAPVGGGRADVRWDGDGRDEALARVADLARDLDRRIRAGGTAARPLDPLRCGSGRCAFADLCRYEGGGDEPGDGDEGP